MRYLVLALAVGCSGDDGAASLVDGAGGASQDAGAGGRSSAGGADAAGGQPVARECQGSGDCDDPDVCVDGSCVAPCAADSDCENGWICVRRMDRGSQCRPSCAPGRDGCDTGECVPFVGDECAVKPDCGDPSTWRYACNADAVCSPAPGVLFYHCGE